MHLNTYNSIIYNIWIISKVSIFLDFIARNYNAFYNRIFLLIFFIILICFLTFSFFLHFESNFNSMQYYHLKSVLSIYIS